MWKREHGHEESALHQRGVALGMKALVILTFGPSLLSLLCLEDDPLLYPTHPILTSC